MGVLIRYHQSVFAKTLSRHFKCMESELQMIEKLRELNLVASLNLELLLGSKACHELRTNSSLIPPQLTVVSGDCF